MAHRYRAPYQFVQGWAVPIHRQHMGNIRMANLWKYFTPFPRHGAPEGYERKREDYRHDFEAIKPYINRYRNETEGVAIFKGGTFAYYFAGIKGFSVVGRQHGQRHKRRLSTLRHATTMTGRRKGLKYHRPQHRILPRF